MESCPLCLGLEVSPLHKSPLQRSGSTLIREFLLCHTCGLVFAHPESFLESAEERDRYSTHENELDNPGYREFLSQLWSPLRERLSATSRPGDLQGLDFGCGPSQAFKELAAEDGYCMETFDPFFYPKSEVIDPLRTYDFIVSTEVVEHFNDPNAGFIKLFSLLGANGHLGVMTRLLTNKESFAGWYYHRDPTHVSFYQAKTINWIAKKFNVNCEILSHQVILFSR